MSLYEKFSTDKNLEKQGIVLDYGDFRVTIARAGGSNKKFNKAIEKASRPYQRAIQTKTIDPEIVNKIMIDCYCGNVILDWQTLVDGEYKKGLQDEKGKLIPFSQDNLKKVLLDLPDLFNDIQEQASQASLYRQEILEENSKN